MEVVKSPLRGVITKSDDGRFIFLTGENNSVTYGNLKLTTTNQYVEKNDVIGEKESGFVEKRFKKSGGKWVPEGGSETNTGNVSNKESQEMSDKQFAHDVIKGGITVGAPGLAIASDIVNSSMKESIDNQSNILTEELRKMKKLMNL